jgi:flagellar basal-body rod protein FlgC
MNLFASLDVSASGLSAQRARVEVLVQNIANSQTTQSPEGGPYRRRQVVFASEPVTATPFARMFRSAWGFGREQEMQGVRVSEVLVDEASPERRYLPGHPDAGPDGYVDFPAFNPVEDMVDLTAAVRSYQANLAAIASVKEMISRTLEISRA